MLNAGAATDGAGTLWISTARRLDRMVVELTFRDNGMGIPEEDLERVFDPFYSTRTGGTGLGLPISKTIIEQNGGRIRISSRSGQGTEVIVTLPMGAAGGR